MPERHKGNIVRLYADSGGAVLADLMKQGSGTTLFTFEVPRKDTTAQTREVMIRFLELALVHALPCVISEAGRQISHVEITRFG